MCYLTLQYEDCLFLTGQSNKVSRTVLSVCAVALKQRGRTGHTITPKFELEMEGRWHKGADWAMHQVMAAGMPDGQCQERCCRRCVLAKLQQHTHKDACLSAWPCHHAPPAAVQHKQSTDWHVQ
jgi:hypothetical protein